MNLSITTRPDTRSHCVRCGKSRAAHRGSYHAYEPATTISDNQILAHCQCGLEAALEFPLGWNWKGHTDLDGIADSLREAGWRNTETGWRCPKCAERIERRTPTAQPPLGQLTFLTE